MYKTESVLGMLRMSWRHPLVTDLGEIRNIAPRMGTAAYRYGMPRLLSYQTGFIRSRLTFLISNAILSIEKGHTDRRLSRNILRKSNPPYVGVRRITFCLS